MKRPEAIKYTREAYVSWGPAHNNTPPVGWVWTGPPAGAQILEHPTEAAITWNDWRGVMPSISQAPGPAPAVCPAPVIAPQPTRPVWGGVGALTAGMLTRQGRVVYIHDAEVCVLSCALKGPWLVVYPLVDIKTVQSGPERIAEAIVAQVGAFPGGQTTRQLVVALEKLARYGAITIPEAKP